MKYAKLKKTFEKCGSNLCIGLDLDIGKYGISIDELEQACLDIVSHANEQNACFTFKLNYAFFSQYGVRGIAVMQNIFEKAGKENFMILDAKRSDIPNTMERYAKECFGFYRCDAVTVVPFFGVESLKPMDQKAGEEDGVVLVVAKPTNPGAGEVVDVDCGKEKLWERIVRACSSGLKNVGFVVQPEASVVEKCRNWPLLLPGVGKQGYDSGNVLRLLDWRHRVNVSRGILYPENQRSVFEEIERFSKELKQIKK